MGQCEYGTGFSWHVLLISSGNVPKERRLVSQNYHQNGKIEFFRVSWLGHIFLSGFGPHHPSFPSMNLSEQYESSSALRRGIPFNFQRRAPNYLVSCRLNNEGVFLALEKGDYKQATRSFLRAFDLVMERYPKQWIERKKIIETVAARNVSPGGGARMNRSTTDHTRGAILSTSTVVAAEYDHGLDQYRAFYRLDDICEKNTTAKILFNLGRAFHNQDHFDIAVDCYKQLLERREEQNGSEELCLAGLFSMAHCQYRLGDLRALPTYWAALSIAKKMEERHHEAACLNAIGMVILSMPAGKHQVALQAFQTALDIRRRCQSQDHHEVGTIWNNMGQSYYKQGNHPKALEAYNEALRVRRSNREAPDGIDVAATLLNLGQVCYHMKKYQHALRYFEDFLRLAKIHFGEYNEDVCHVTTCVGQVLQSLGQLERSMKSYQDALRIAHVIYSPLHRDAAVIQKRIATLYYGMKKYDLALQSFREALEVELQIFDEGDAQVLVSYSNIAEIHKELGDFDVSLTWYEKVLKAQKSSSDGSTQNQMAVAATLNRLARVHCQKGNYEVALELQQECIFIQREHKGDDAHDVASSLFRIGWLLLKLDSSKMALETMLEACRVQKKTCKEDRQSVTAFCRMASIYLRHGFLDSALVCYHEAARVHEAILGTGHGDFSNILLNTSQLYYEKGELGIALQMLRQVLKIEGRYVETRDQRSLRTLMLIGEIETNLGNLPGLMEAYGEVLRIYQADAGEERHVLVPDATLWRFDRVVPPCARAA
jgi:tetratricopeptide (TPR) repeat protein